VCLSAKCNTNTGAYGAGDSVALTNSNGFFVSNIGAECVTAILWDANTESYKLRSSVEFITNANSF